MIELGTLYYNEFFFPHAVNTNVSIKPVRDSTDTFTKWVEYELSVKFIAYPGCDEAFRDVQKPDGTGTYFPLFPEGDDDVDPGVDQLRERLTDSGNLLQFINKGLGEDLTIVPNAEQQVVPGNTPRNVTLKYGPHPTILQWEPVGTNKAIAITWGCVFRLAECVGTPPARGQIGEFSFEIAWSIDGKGLTTRTVSGLMIVSVQRKESLRLNSADLKRSTNINIQLPINFQRTSQNFVLSSDRSTLAFSIVDKEIISDSPLFPGVIDANVSHSMTSHGNTVFSGRWSCTISGSITVSKDTPKSVAWIAFLQIVDFRLKQIKLHAKVKRLKKDRYAEDKGSKLSQFLMLNKVSITEEIFGKGMSFSLTYTIFTTKETLFKANGIWTRVPGSTVDQYRNSQVKFKGPADVRGHAQLAHEQKDIIISFCGGDSTGLSERDKYPGTFTERFDVFGTPCPPKEDSYREFEVWSELVTDSERVYNKPLGGDDTYAPVEVTPSLDESNIGFSTSGNRKRPVISSRSNSFYLVRFAGFAKRLGFKIPEVHLIEYGGQTVQLYGKYKFTHVVFKKTEDCVMYLARWEATYILDGPPQNETVVTKPDRRVFIE